MQTRWTLAATVLGLVAGFAACASGQKATPSGATSGTGGTGGAPSASGAGAGGTSGSSTAGTGGSGGGPACPSTPATCGDGTVDPGEDCDGNDFAGKTCLSFGFASGTLACNPCCHFVASGCEPFENCLDEVDDNNNGLVDCQDPQCFGKPGCVDSCSPAYHATLPGTASGDTTGRPAVHRASCSSAPGGKEQIFVVVAPATGTMSVQLGSITGVALSLSVRTSCDVDASEIACNHKANAGTFGNIVVGVHVDVGQSYFVMVQGMTPKDVGGFTLALDMPGAEMICNDEVDNDFNGFVDCDDPNCQTLPDCAPGASPTGQPCLTNTECTANHRDPICLDTPQFPGGYCSEFCDLAGDDCSAGNVCYAGLALSKNGVCLHGCTVDQDCGAGYSCVDAGLPRKVCLVAEILCNDYADNNKNGLVDCQDPIDCQILSACAPGTKAIGQPCTQHGECFANRPDPVCLDEQHLGYPGGYCSHFCDPSVATDCGANGLCAPEGPGGAHVCMQTCTGAGQCRTGYSCQDFGYPKMICSF